MSEESYGTVSATITEWENGVDLVLSTLTPARLETVWTFMTDPEKTALWCAPWAYTDREASVIELSFDDGVVQAHIASLVEQDHVLLDVSGLGTVGMSLRTAPAGLDAQGPGQSVEVTRVFFTHTFESGAAASVAVPEVGPVWESHLRLLLECLAQAELVNSGLAEVSEEALMERYEKLAETVPGYQDSLFAGVQDHGVEETGAS